MRLFNTYDEAKECVQDAHRAIGLPTDEAGTRKLLITLRALHLTDWLDDRPPPTSP